MKEILSSQRLIRTLETAVLIGAMAFGIYEIEKPQILRPPEIAYSDGSMLTPEITELGRQIAIEVKSNNPIPASYLTDLPRIKWQSQKIKASLADDPKIAEQNQIDAVTGAVMILNNAMLPNGFTRNGLTPEESKNIENIRTCALDILKATMRELTEEQLHNLSDERTGYLLSLINETATNIGCGK